MESGFVGTIKQLENFIGAKAELAITSGLNKGSYPSSLEDIDGELLGVSLPALRVGILQVSQNTKLFVKIETPYGIYQGTAVAMQSDLTANVPLLWLKLVSALDKVQRRMFVRVSSSFKADAFFLGETEIKELPEGVTLPPKQWFSVRVTNISLGGIGIGIGIGTSLKDNPLPYCFVGGRYLLLLKIGKAALFVPGRIVKILKKKEGSIEVGFSYDGLSVSAEKILLGYIRQQELAAR